MRTARPQGAPIDRDPSVAGFCARKGISRATYINNRKRGRGPREIQPMPGGRIVITPEAEAEWENRFSKPALPGKIP
jgi:hypothetical protein